MRYRISNFFAFALSLGLSSVAHAEDCATSVAAFNDAREVGEVYAIIEANDAIFHNASCTGGMRDQASRLAARAVARIAFEEETPADLERLLQQSYRLRPIWHVTAAIADLALGRGNYTLAAQQYQEALSLIDDPAETSEPPEQTVIAAIYANAQEAGLLSPIYVRSRRNRSSGAPEGLGDNQIRGFTPRRTALPVTFVFEQATFDEQGRQAAQDLLEVLQIQMPTQIHLVGHTDERGGISYNDDLSSRRVDALVRYLRENGYEGGIQTEGRGEREPFETDNASRYSQEERWRLDRRVELVRDSS